MFQKTPVKIRKYLFLVDETNFRLPYEHWNLNSKGVSTSNMLLTRMVLKEKHLCKCCNKDAPVSSYTKVVSFSDINFGLAFEFLLLEGLSGSSSFLGTRCGFQ
jgi:hypothetical protein